MILKFWRYRLIHKCHLLGADDDALEAALGLGDLASLTITNEADPLSYDVSVFNRNTYRSPADYSTE